MCKGQPNETLGIFFIYLFIYTSIDPKRFENLLCTEQVKTIWISYLHLVRLEFAALLVCDEITFVLQHMYVLTLVQIVILDLVVLYLYLFLVGDRRSLADCSSTLVGGFSHRSELVALIPVWQSRTVFDSRCA